MAFHPVGSDDIWGEHEDAMSRKSSQREAVDVAVRESSVSRQEMEVWMLRVEEKKISNFWTWRA